MAENAVEKRASKFIVLLHRPDCQDSFKDPHNPDTRHADRTRGRQGEENKPETADEKS